MATVTDIRHNPLSGNTFVDALLNQDGLNWNYVTDIPPNTIRYSFAAGGFDMADNTDVSGTATPFTAAQEAAARQALAYLTEVTGIHFQETTPDVADVHFANAAIVSERIVGEFFWKGNYLEDGAGKITRYEVDGVLYLDNAEFANYNAQPAPGSPAYQTLLHELVLHLLGDAELVEHLHQMHAADAAALWIGDQHSLGREKDPLQVLRRVHLGTRAVGCDREPEVDADQRHPAAAHHLVLLFEFVGD